MRPFTKTSRALALGAALFVALLSAPAAPAASVATVSFAEIGRLGEASAKKQALFSALAKAVGDVVERHLPESEWSGRATELSSLFFSSPASFIARQTVLSEASENGAVKVAVEAEVDEKAILGLLKAKGFSVIDPREAPRFLILYGGDFERALAAELASRLDGGGYRSSVLPFEGGDPASLAREKALNFAILLGGAGGDSRFKLIDSRKGLVVGSGEIEAAEGEDGAKVCAWAVEHKALTLFNRSGWVAGEEKLSLEVRAGEIDNPGLAEKLEEAIGSLAETLSVKLALVEAGTVVFRVAALDSGMDFSKIFSTMAFDSGEFSWKSSFLEKGAPFDPARPSLLIEGRWKRK